MWYYEITGQKQTPMECDDMRITKKILGIVMTICMVLTCTSLPLTAQAEDTAKEKALSEFTEKFNSVYITDGMSEYNKVKTIYDFVVRHTAYDTEVYKGSYADDTERYANAHSAYGAAFGTGNIDDLSWDTQTTVDGQKVPTEYDRGLAVCEGYSDLFRRLCKSNGIDTAMIQGDYTDSTKDSDPHQWDCVYITDPTVNTKKWYLIDTTFSSQKSVKQVEYTDYNYFLRGTENKSFGANVHQQPYTNKDYPTVSKEDYPFSNKSEDIDDDLASGKRSIVMRQYSINGTTYASYLYSANDGTAEKILVDEEGKIHLKNVDGFFYNGKKCTYTVSIPYVVNGTVKLNGDDMVNVGTYKKSVNGYPISIVISPLDMSDHNDDTKIQTSANYTGIAVDPAVSVTDGFGNTLTKNNDYTVQTYSDSALTKTATIKNIGTYYVDIKYRGNYTGHYSFKFTMDKIKLSTLTNSRLSYQYLPEKLRPYYNISSMKDYYEYGANTKPLTVGDLQLDLNTDYKVSAKGDMSYGSTGTITLTGLNNSKKVIANDSKSLKYTIDDKYNITSLGIDGKAAVSKAFTYTGNEIKPEPENINQYLVKGSEYKITGYSSNINAGKGYVTITGTGGCTGTAKLYFVISKASMASDVKVSKEEKNNVFSYAVTYRGRTLKNGTDYTENLSFSGDTCKIKLTGKGNFNGSYTMNIKGLLPPSSKGNKIKLSKSTVTYNGKSQKLGVKVTDSKGRVINPFLYTVSYKNNTKVGKATVTVKFKTGAKAISATYKIVPKGTKITKLSAGKKAFTAKIKKNTAQTTGYQICYSTSSKFKSAKTVTVSNKTTSKKISSLKSKKKYYVRLRTYKTVGKTKYYSSWSKTYTVKTK